MQVPDKLIQSLSGVPGFDKDNFLRVHQEAARVTSVRLNPAKVPGPAALDNLFAGEAGERPVATAVPWSSQGYYLSRRPSFTFDPLFHAGAYYVQEASSMFIETALRQVADLSASLRVLDACAAPGGKSTLLQSIISPGSLLVSNDVIKPRAAILEENMVKWGGANVVVTNNDPAHFARLQHYFDVMVVDAPCSGSGLFRRDPAAIGEWSEENVQLCSARQQRILGSLWPALKKGGILVYSTCSFSREEDEAVAEWLLEHFAGVSLRVGLQADWQIVETVSKENIFGYRFYPDKLPGEGFFITVLQKQDGDEPVFHNTGTLSKTSAAERHVLEPWVREDSGTEFLKQGERYIAFPGLLANDLALLQQALYIKSAGVGMGKIIRDELIPDHPLALSCLTPAGIAAASLDYDQAIAFLRKEAVSGAGMPRGWVLAAFAGIPMGWMKVLPGRVNNYYPKEWRITKQTP